MQSGAGPGLPDHSGEALAEPFPVQTASGPRCGPPGPPVAKAGLKLYINWINIRLSLVKYFKEYGNQFTGAKERWSRYSTLVYVWYTVFVLM